LGLYSAVVFTIATLVRMIFYKAIQRVIYEEMPNPDDLLELCNAIYIARMEGNLVKEERLYDLLIRIHRSPEIMMKMTGTSYLKQK